jgi:hypothetical protein
MKSILMAMVCLAVLACEISPVVSAPEDPGSRYSDCDRAAREYCEDTLKTSDAEMDSCVAEYRFKCVSNEARLLAPHRF